MAADDDDSNVSQHRCKVQTMSPAQRRQKVHVHLIIIIIIIIIISLPRDAPSAKRGIAIVSRSSVCLSVTLSYRGFSN